MYQYCSLSGIFHILCNIQWSYCTVTVCTVTHHLPVGWVKSLIWRFKPPLLFVAKDIYRTFACIPNICGSYFMNLFISKHCRWYVSYQPYCYFYWWCTWIYRSWFLLSVARKNTSIVVFIIKKCNLFHVWVEQAVTVKFSSHALKSCVFVIPFFCRSTISWSTVSALKNL